MKRMNGRIATHNTEKFSGTVTYAVFRPTLTIFPIFGTTIAYASMGQPGFLYPSLTDKQNGEVEPSRNNGTSLSAGFFSSVFSLSALRQEGRYRPASSCCVS